MAAPSTPPSVVKPHGTEQEMHYITGLGQLGWKRDQNNYDPREALGNYIKVAAKRTNWQGINKANVLRYAQSVLVGLG